MRRFVLVVLLAACQGPDGNTDAPATSSDADADADGDGVPAPEDCDDGDDAISPGAPDQVGDGVDQDCDGVDGVDGDGDGAASLASGGDDCLDADASFGPGFPDVVGDGLDQSCDGVDGLDEDGDGFAGVGSGGADCEDTDPLVAPVDADGDGLDPCTGDCDEADPGVFAGAPETCDGIDQDCDLLADYAGASDACARQESFAMTYPAVDILLVVDNSCSMIAKQDRLADAAADLLTPLVGVVDYHLGVVTTDMNDVNQSGKLQGTGGTTYLDGTEALADAVTWLDAVARQGNNGWFDERGADAVYAAIETWGDTSNAGFYREDAELAVLILSDEDDYSTLTPATFGAWFAALKPYPEAVTWSSVAGPDPLCGPDHFEASLDYIELTSTFGGLFWPICEADLSVPMTDFAGFAAVDGVVDGVFVVAEPLDPATLVVTVTEPDGTVVTASPSDYVYDPVALTLAFTGYVPPYGSEVSLAYRALPQP